MELAIAPISASNNLSKRQQNSSQTHAQALRAVLYSNARMLSRRLALRHINRAACLVRLGEVRRDRPGRPRRHRFCIELAGAPGFEPGITGPKPNALPLGHAPRR